MPLARRPAASPERRTGRARCPASAIPGHAILILGLAPAANGGNRTGRIFTGDESGNFLWPALHAAGLANQPTSIRAGDGLVATGAWVTAAVKCAPPGNKPLPQERGNCAPYLERELAALDALRVVVALGAFAWDAALSTFGTLGHAVPRPKPRFGHGAEVRDRAVDAPRELPRQPAEHVHRAPHPPDARYGLRASDQARGGQAGGALGSGGLDRRGLARRGLARCPALEVGVEPG